VGVKCCVCGDCFVLGNEFYELVPVKLTSAGIESQNPYCDEENDYICKDCVNVDLTPIDEPDNEPAVNYFDRD
jgi:hypothetical protein